MTKKNENTFEIIKEAVKVALGEMDITTKDDLKYLPDKDTFFEETLKIMKRLDNIEEQTKMLSNRTYDNTDKIEKLQKIHPHNSHQVFA
ncbi:MAG: hypothetical protein AAB625_03000 [Patescibacteria group bacterium]